MLSRFRVRTSPLHAVGVGVADSEPRELTSGQSDERNHPARPVAIATPGKKLRGVAKSAAAHDFDAGWRDSRSD
jgi:hypothetical protein